MKAESSAGTRDGVMQHHEIPMPDSRKVNLPTGRDSGHAIAMIFDMHYKRLCQHTIAMGVSDPDDAEDMVAEAFCQLHARWATVKDIDAAVGYVWSILRNLVRMRIRHSQVVRRHEPVIATEAEAARSAEHEALLRSDRQAVVQALRTLPRRQREAICMRFWFEFTDAEIARTMHISTGAVKVHLFRGCAGLRCALRNETEQM